VPGKNSGPSFVYIYMTKLAILTLVALALLALAVGGWVVSALRGPDRLRLA
jgi:hypothetical protein